MGLSVTWTSEIKGNYNSLKSFTYYFYFHFIVANYSWGEKGISSLLVLWMFSNKSIEYWLQNKDEFTKEQIFIEKKHFRTIQCTKTWSTTSVWETVSVWMRMHQHTKFRLNQLLHFLLSLPPPLRLGIVMPTGLVPFYIAETDVF